MSLTKPLNSKVNMKQYSNADLPVNPKQPATAQYGNLMIADLANNMLDNSLALGSNTVTVASTSGFCLSTKARVNVPPGTTLTVKLRLRFGLSSSTGSVTFGVTTYTGSLTDPEVSPKFFAKRAA